MFKARILCGLVAAACASAGAAAAGSEYFVVVPVKARTTGTADIQIGLSGATLPAGLVGNAYSGFDFKPLLQVTGDTAYTGYGVKWSVASGRLPAGLELTSDGRLTGTPTEDGTVSFQVRATYRTKSGAAAYQVFVGKLTVTLAAATPHQAIVGQAYNYNLLQHVQVPADSTFAGTGVTWAVVSGTLPQGLSLRTDGTIAGTPVAAGTGELTVRATYRGSNGEQQYRVVSLALNVGLTSATPPTALVGQAYNYDLRPHLSVTGDPGYPGTGAVSWELVSGTLPAGLQLLSNGSISGTPTTASTAPIVVRASYRGVSGQQTYQMVSIAISVALAAATPAQGIVGQAYSYDLKQHLSVTGDSAYTGAGVTWSVDSGSLPAGLQLNSNGTITGTPSEAATRTITARASYRGSSGQRAYQVVTFSIYMNLVGAQLPQARVGEYYTYDIRRYLTVTTGDPAYRLNSETWTQVASSLPTGLSFSNGVISGTPSAATSGSLTAYATYRGVSSVQQAYNVTAQPAYTYAWATGPYIGPEQEYEGQYCGERVRVYREVWCQRSDGATVSDSSCTTTRPIPSKSVTYAC